MTEVLERTAQAVRKETVSKASSGDGLDFVLSDDTVDRMDDQILPDGWDLKWFKRNPIALFNHNPHAPIGRWSNVRVEDGALRGRLELAAEGTSARIDEIRQLVKQGILRAVSVGFRALERRSRPESERGGIIFVRQELLETSLVSVPANPAALSMAKAMNISPETQSLVFGKSAAKDTIAIAPRAITGKSAERNSDDERTRKMSTIAERVQNAQTELTASKAALETFESGLDNSDIKEDQIAKLQELTKQVQQKQSAFDALSQTEQVLGANSRPAGTPAPTQNEQRVVPHSPSIVPTQRPWATPKEKIRPGEHVLRSLVACVVGQAKKKNPAQILTEFYGQDGHVDPETKTVFDVVTRGDGINVHDFLVTRAATAPATTTTSGWASQLVQTTNADFMQLLMPASVYPGLASRGLRLSFGRSGVISIPSRVATPTIAGSFVAEGSPIPVRQGAFTSITFTPKKMAVITSWTREIGEHSIPAIEGLVRNAIQEDTSVSLDTVLLDATAASTTRPAGLRNGVSVTTATSGGGFAALVGDIKALLGALITGSNGNLRNPVWIMNPTQAISIALTQNAGGDFPFASEINNNRLQGYPVVISSNVTAGMVILVDAADFVVIEGGAPRFDLSDQAVLVYDDTTPAALGTAATPNVVGAPARSLWQTDSVALRMIMDVNWGMRRTGVVAWTQSVTW